MQYAKQKTYHFIGLLRSTYFRASNLLWNRNDKLLVQRYAFRHYWKELLLEGGIICVAFLFPLYVLASGPSPSNDFDQHHSFSLVSGGFGQSTTISISQLSTLISTPDRTDHLYRFFASTLAEPTQEDILTCNVNCTTLSPTGYNTLGFNEQTTTQITFNETVPADALSIIGVFTPYVSNVSDPGWSGCTKAQANYLPYNPSSDNENTQTWECDTWDWDYINASSTNSDESSDVVLTIMNPPSLALWSDPLPEFSNWVYYVEGLNPLLTYYFRIHPIFVTSTTPGDTVDLPTDHETFSGITSSPGGRILPKTFPLQPPLGIKRTFDIQATLCYDIGCFDIVTSSSIQIQMQFGGDSPNTPYAAKGGPWDATNDPYANGEPLGGTEDLSNVNTDWCGPASSSTGWFGIVPNVDNVGWGLCRLFEIAMKPSTTTSQKFINSTEKVKSLYPIKYIFDITDSAKAGMNAGLYESIPTLSFSMPFNISGTTTTFTTVLLSSSSLSSLAGTTNKNNIFTVEEYVFWFFSLGTVVVSVAKAFT